MYFKIFVFNTNILKYIILSNILDIFILLQSLLTKDLKCQFLIKIIQSKNVLEFVCMYIRLKFLLLSM